MANNRERDVVLNFKMNGQVQYAQTLKQINMVMNNAAKEYKNHIAAMGRDASVTDKLRAEKQKLEIQMEGARKRTRMLREEYEAMANDTNTSAEELNKMYGRLLDAERAETSLQTSLERVNGGLSEQALEARDAKDKLGELQGETKLLEAEKKNLASAMRLETQALDENATEAEKLELAQSQLTRQMDLTERTIANLENQLEQTKRVYGENSIEVMQMETRLNEARSTLNNFRRSMDQVGDSADDAGTDLEEIGNKLDLNNLMEATELLQGVTDKLLELGTAAMDSSLEFGNSQSYLQANLGVSADEAEKLNSIVEDVFRNGVVGSVDEASEAVMLAKRAFSDLNDVELTKLTNNLTTIAKRTGTDVNENVIAAEKLMMEFGYTSEEAMDLLSAGYENGLNKSGDFLDTINEYAPLFADAQFSGEQMMESLKNGLEGGARNTDLAADAIKELQIRFGDGTFKDNLDMFSEDTAKLFKGWEKGEVTMAEVMNSIQKDIQKMDSSKQQEALSTLSTQFEDLGIRGSTSLLGIGDGLDDVNGKADQMAEKSPGEKWESSLRELQQSLLPVGQNLVDTLTPIVDCLAEIGEWFSKLPGPIQTFVTVFGGVLVVAGALTPVIIGLVVAIGALNLSLLPIIGIVVGVAAAIAGIVLVIQNWGAVTDWIGNKWDQFTSWLSEATSNLATNFVNWFNDMKNGAVNKFNELKDQGLAKVNDLKNSGEAAVQKFKTNVVNKATELKDGFVNKATQLKDNTIGKFNELKNRGEGLVKGLKDGAINKLNELKDKAGDAMEEAKENILSPIETAKEKISGVIEDIKGFFENLKLKIPKPEMPKMPTFSLETSTKTIFDKKITYPSGIGIKWNAKGGIFTRPTIFGMNNGVLQGAGEVPGENEAVLPLNEQTLGDIGKGIAATMKGNGVTQHITIVSPEPSSPSENARKMKQAARQLAMEW